MPLTWRVNGVDQCAFIALSTTFEMVMEGLGPMNLFTQPGGEEFPSLLANGNVVNKKWFTCMQKQEKRLVDYIVAAISAADFDPFANFLFALRWLLKRQFAMGTVTADATGRAVYSAPQTARYAIGRSAQFVYFTPNTYDPIQSGSWLLSALLAAGGVAVSSVLFSGAFAAFPAEKRYGDALRLVLAPMDSAIIALKRTSTLPVVCFGGTFDISDITLTYASEMANRVCTISYRGPDARGFVSRYNTTPTMMRLSKTVKVTKLVAEMHSSDSDRAMDHVAGSAGRDMSFQEWIHLQ
jgi:hypothetical protein